MNLKRATIIGVILWIAIFFEVSILKFGLKLEGIFYYIFHYILLVILTVIASIYYLKGKKIAKNLREGFLIGVTFVIVGVILDAIFTVPLFVKNFNFFFDLGFLIGLLEVIIVSALVGAIKR